LYDFGDEGKVPDAARREKRMIDQIIDDPVQALISVLPVAKTVKKLKSASDVEQFYKLRAEQQKASTTVERQKEIATKLTELGRRTGMRYRPFTYDPKEFEKIDDDLIDIAIKEVFRTSEKQLLYVMSESGIDKGEKGKRAEIPRLLKKLKAANMAGLRDTLDSTGVDIGDSPFNRERARIQTEDLVKSVSAGWDRFIEELTKRPEFQ
jgi:hypothetical protein